MYEDVARDTNRGHTVQATCESFHMAKDAGFKVVSHMMVRAAVVSLDVLAVLTARNCSRTCPMLESSATWSSSSSTLRTPRSARTD